MKNVFRRKRSLHQLKIEVTPEEEEINSEEPINIETVTSKKVVETMSSNKVEFVATLNSPIMAVTSAVNTNQEG